MALRWATAVFLKTEKHFRKIGSYQQMQMLKSYLDELRKEQNLAQPGQVG
ncbi:MAG TPA: hypothetical protein PK525_12280 [Anaerohalosphaeraceae bacterium]|nr:hypothetical protein [Anaerohalosphaeraceae bacterium]HRT24645.1 hypothetical protein [Anaerohalosphaeraceae bacterium]HRU15986.1 hypothetical protein [Anaerohalosphaeraceae bacterium]